MPKVVDHEERRRRLTEAVWSLTVRSGLESVTLRKVAAEAGVSMGQVQHYYATRSELVADAVARAVGALNARIEASIREAGAEGDPEAILRECLYAVLARDEEGLRLLRLSVALVGQAVSDPAMATVLAPSDDGLVSFTAGLIAAARHERGSPTRDDDRIAADICWTLATGLGVDVALGHRSPDAAKDVLDHHIDIVLALGG
ncbi:TetR/AcrR family transcriptional regulator [Actinomadura algeriensis]|uniref:AcrR family transcriptional regulator n=1 Tax=Actinomadura algeriensis TaxID=1679523 RepID=A0ABR9JJP7_9ACTN|nr:TetR family transcriptional regulator C-terminal domain-containing protein [Actinomadura algeriensis]MBE1530785.1 AcrR family transcriptional regulator [Actinomadura algeriensis]